MKAHSSIASPRSASVRRGLPEVGDLDLLIVTNDPWAFHGNPAKPRKPEREADLFVATPETYGAVLAFSTGPHKLNRVLRDKAREKGYRLAGSLKASGFRSNQPRSATH